MRKRFLNICFISLVAFSSVAAQDSLKTLDYQSYIDLVKAYHPIAFQAQLKTQEGEAYVQKSRGAFDPKLAGDLNQKYFEGKQYYSHLDAMLKVPTWYGIEVQGGYLNNNGTRLNPEEYTSNTGILYAGVTVNLGNGLFIDQRRAELKQAAIYKNSTELEQKLMLNQLIFDASIVYWDWFKAYYKVKIYEDAVQNADIRLKGIRESAFLGDKPFVDTLKASIQVQNRQLELKQAKLSYQNKVALLEVFLWLDGTIPLELDSLTVPQPYDMLIPSQPGLEFPSSIDAIASSHPERMMAQNKIDYAKIDFRLSREQLKPTVKLKYNTLTRQENVVDFANYSLNNYNWGVQVAYPLFTRKERGALKLVDLKIQEQEAGMANKQSVIKYKIKAGLNNWNSTYEQVTFYANTVVDYENLLRAETQLFNMGESSVFLVNIRESDFIKAQVNYIELLIENQQANLLTKFAACTFIEDLD